MGFLFLSTKHDIFCPKPRMNIDETFLNSNIFLNNTEIRKFFLMNFLQSLINTPKNLIFLNFNYSKGVWDILQIEINNKISSYLILFL